MEITSTSWCLGDQRKRTSVGPGSWTPVVLHPSGPEKHACLIQTPEVPTGVPLVEDLPSVKVDVMGWTEKPERAEQLLLWP